ncbi:MAG: hypothetical protein KAT30_13335, partial [Candidatus Krumholzibacteria bacterium]|nr:hypothetical protein [Candidatus Krumholzibacteria bacterium]
MSNILVFAEIRDGVFKGINAELVTAAQTLVTSGGGEVYFALIGDGLDAQVDEAKKYEVNKVFTVTGPELAAYSSQGYATAMEAIIGQCNPKIVLFGATAMGKDLSARVAARIGAALFADCTELSLEGGNLKVTRPVYSGKVYMQATAKAAIQMASVRPNINTPAEASGGTAEVVAVSTDVGDIKGIVKEFVSTAGG